MDKRKKLTLDELIARASQSQNDKLKFWEYESKTLGGSLQFEKVPVTVLTDILDRDSDNTMTSGLDANIQIIYKTCPMMREKQLQEAYGCAEPSDIVLKLFNDNLGEINEAVKVIMRMYGLAEEIEKVKN